MTPVRVTLIAVALVAAPVLAQRLPQPDTTVVFTPSHPDLVTQSSYSTPVNAWGLDIMVSDNGFALGTFYRREFTDEYAASVTFAISDVKDDQEVEYYTRFGSFVPGKKNRLLLLPLMVSMQYRLFKDDILDNFRPFITAGAGPTMIYVSPYAVDREFSVQGGTVTLSEQVDFFSSLKHGQAKYTVGGFLGAGAFFGSERTTLSGLSLRYYYVPFPGGIEVLKGLYVKKFGGFYITLHFGSFY